VLHNVGVQQSKVSQGRDYDKSYLLKCNAAQPGRSIQTVERNLLLSSPRQFMYLKNLQDIIVFKKRENINIAYFFMTEAVEVSEELP